MPGSLAKILAGFSTNQAIALVSTGQEVIDSAGKLVNDQMIPTVGSYICGYDKAPLFGRLVSETILRNGVNFIGECCTVAVRRNALGELFDTSFVHVGDLEYWIRVLQFGDYLHLTERLCKFRQHSNSTTRANLKGLRFATDLLRLFVSDLERSVRLLLGSHSWRLTRALRELRARLLGLEPTELLLSCTESSAQDSIRIAK